ncbi:MAG: hypothetical protein M0Z78_08740 [Betaproteobacteria bacterium]|nr:hypothetical protein [Betaproteobacteria bacterium]
MDGYNSKDRNEVGNVIGALAIAGALAVVASPIALLAGAAALAGIGQSLWDNTKGDGVGKANKYDVEMQKLKIQEVKDRIAMNKEMHQQKMEQMKVAKKDEKSEVKKENKGVNAEEKKNSSVHKVASGASLGASFRVSNSGGHSGSHGAQAMAYVRATNGLTESAKTGGAASAKAQSDYFDHKQSIQKGVAELMKSDQKSRGQVAAADFKSQINSSSSAKNVKPTLEKAKEASRSGLAKQTGKASTGSAATSAKAKNGVAKSALKTVSKVAASGRVLSETGAKTKGVAQKTISAASSGVKNVATKVATAARR